MFDSMIQQTREVTTSGLCRGELEGLVSGAGRVMAALGALQTRCAVEIEALGDGGVNSKTVLREAGRMSTRAANSVAKTAAGVAEIVGGEALPQTVLERLMCTAAVTGVVFDGEGEPIWVGRTHRHATEAQVKAIIARDRHCRGKDCTAGPERCEIHHIVPWKRGGLTDIDSMCLACLLCHHNIHDRGYIVTKTSTGYKIINPNNPPNGP